MALTNQPYLPLYVNDWLSNTKLKSCSALAHGIMINIMLLMHKEDGYGIILLKQKFKQSDKQIKNFALQLAKVLPFDLLEIETGLIELLDENSLYIDADSLICKRMIKDADISLKRSLSGSKGGKETMKPKIFAQAKKQAKVKANADNEIIIDIAILTNSLFAEKLKSVFERWVKYKKDRGEKYKTQDSLNTAFKKLEKYCNGDPVQADKIINSAIGNNYAGFFELPFEKSTTQTVKVNTGFANI